MLIPMPMPMPMPMAHGPCSMSMSMSMASRRRTRGVFAFEVRNGVAESERREWRDDGEKEHRPARLRTHLLQQGRLSE